MNRQDWGNVIGLMRRAPLANMDEAEAVDQLITKLSKYAKEQLQDDVPEPEDVNEIKAGDTA